MMISSRWVNVALIISVGVNILVLGFVFGRGLPFGDHAGMHRIASDRLDPTAGYFRVLHNWPEKRREIFRPIIREHMMGMRNHFREIPPLHREIQATLNAEPFDPAALDSALEKLRTHLQISQEKTHTSLIELAKTMSLEERQRLAREIRKPSREFGRRRPPDWEAGRAPGQEPGLEPGPEHNQSPD